MVGGGDGTLGSAASALAGTEVALGVLPLGTLNHFAKDLGLPIELDAAMDTVAANKPVAIDVAEVNGRVFLNNSSIGIYPFFVAKRSAEQRHEVGQARGHRTRSRENIEVCPLAGSPTSPPKELAKGC